MNRQKATRSGPTERYRSREALSASTTSGQKRPVGTRRGTAGGCARQTNCSQQIADIASATIDTVAKSARKFTAHGTLRAGHSKDQVTEMRVRWGTGVRGAPRQAWTALRATCGRCRLSRPASMIMSSWPPARSRHNFGEYETCQARCTRQHFSAALAPRRIVSAALA